MLPSGIIGLLCWRLLGRPFVIIEHSGGLHLLRGSPAGIRIARTLVVRARRTYVVSSDLKEKLTDIAPEAACNVEVFPMGVDCALYLNATQHDRIEPKFAGPKDPGQRDDGVLRERLKVLFIGRLTPIKGADLLIRAAAELTCIDITIAGDGEVRDSLRRLSESLEVPVHFAGYVDRAEKRVLIEDCDVMVVPSILLECGRSEGLPVACLEGMAAAKAVVASRTGGLADLIDDGDNGLLFEPGDHKMLGSKLQQLYEHPCLRIQLGARAAGTAQDYDWTIIGQRLRKSLAGLL